MTEAEARQIIVPMVQEIMHAVDERFAKRQAELLELATAIKQYVDDQKSEMKYCGIWESVHEYQANNFATYGGGVWCCMNSGTRQKPGTGPDWRLAVKAGRDGKGAR